MALLNPQTALDEVVTLLKAASLVKDVYNYRTLPDLLTDAISVSFDGGIPTASATAGPNGYYIMGAAMAVQHGADPASLEAAEAKLNEIEVGIYNALYGTRNDYWVKVIFDEESRRPPNPSDTIPMRMGIIRFKLLLK